MGLEKLFTKILDDNRVDYTAIELIQSVPASDNLPLSDIPLDHIVKDILLHCEEDEDLYLVIYPANRIFELDKLRKVFGYDFQFADNHNIEAILQRYSRNKLPPLNTSPGLHILMDEALSDVDTIFYRATVLNKGFIINVDDFHHLVSNEKIGISFTRIDESLNETLGSVPAMNLTERMKHMRKLSPLQDTSLKLLTLRERYQINADQLISIVERDPVLTSQIISYANSAFFGQTGSIKSLKDAIFRVLGVNAVVDLALGLSVGRSLSIPYHGRLGAQRMWRHASYSAALMQKLAMMMPWGKRPDIGVAYLSGLLHDIGFFVLGYLFRKEYNSLVKMIELHPDVPVIQLEHNLLGITHYELGQMAMHVWKMPEVITTVVRHHHDQNYEGEHAVYVLLLNLVEQLLSSQGLTDTLCGEISDSLLAKLGLEEETVILAADEVIQAGRSLEDMANQLCA